MRSAIPLPLLPLLLFVAAAPASAATPCAGLFAEGRAPVLTDARLAPRTTLLCNADYAVLASGITHGALWSAEHPTAASLDRARDTRRQGDFHVEDRLPPADRASLEDYRDSGYDRGHMAPSGDMPDEAAQQQSFSLANMVPQTAALNRGVWEGVESAVRHLASREGELYLVTGAAFHGKRIRTIGPDAVLVPSATWKAVYDPSRAATGVYVCKNNRRPTCTVLSVAVLIQAVGIDPFPALPDSEKQTAMALPPPEPSPYAGHGAHRRRNESLLERLIDR